MSDADIHALMLSILKRKGGAGDYTQPVKLALAQGLFSQQAPVPLLEGELPAIVIYESKRRDRVASLLTTRRVIVMPAGGAAECLEYGEIADTKLMPAGPEVPRWQASRMKIIGREGQELILEGEGNASFHAVAAVLQNRIHAALHGSVT